MRRGQTPADAPSPVPIERFDFWEGQTLRAGDLNRLTDVAEARRWWHNRAVHNAYGIAYGFDVAPIVSDAKNKRWPTGIRLTRGIAYDCFGRMLTEPFDRDVPFPSDVPTVTACLLVIRWRREDRDGCCSPRLPCCGGERMRAADDLELAWVDEARAQARDGVPLARLILRRGLRRDPHLDPAFVAPRIHAARRPHIIADTTLRGATAWTPGPSTLVHPVPETRSLVWFPVDVDVDTTAAGFSETPAYFAELSGPIVDVRQQQVLRALSPHIVDETPERFTFRFWILVMELFFRGGPAVVQGAFTFEGFKSFARRQRLCVAWLGCECERRPASMNPRQRTRMSCCAAPAMPLSI